MSEDTMTVLTIKQACQRLGIAKSTFFRCAAAGGDFPQKVQLSPGRVGYRKCDIEAWLVARQRPEAWRHRPNVEAA
jgi:predicted DNA-binding transcriptional regulator AlpA